MRLGSLSFLLSLRCSIGFSLVEQVYWTHSLGIQGRIVGLRSLLLRFSINFDLVGQA